MFLFSSRPGEVYDDPDFLGVLLDTACPACGEKDSVLVSVEEFEEMTSSRAGPRD